MYRSFFQLRERPFDLTPNPRFLVLTNGHREALSNLEYGIASRRGITLLLGEAGTGKTTVIRAALERQPDRVHCVHLHNPALTRDEFVMMLATRFELSEDACRSKTTLLLELERLMRARDERNESTVLIIDEAQSIPLELLEEIRLLANIETDETKLLPVVLAGQPELAARLNDNALRQLKQRIALRCELRPLSMKETLAYIAGRIAVAGGVGARVFTREAVTLIHERSRGIPRTISVIADNALLTAFAIGERPVGHAVVEEVCRDLDLDPAPAPDFPSERVPDGRETQSSRNGGGRVIAVEDAGAGQAPSSEPAPPAPRDGQDGRPPVIAREPLFAALYRKRRRFPFFGAFRSREAG